MPNRGTRRSRAQCEIPYVHPDPLIGAIHTLTDRTCD